MTKYVLGICLVDSNRVVVVKKNRPEVMVGKLNAPGGHIFEDEAPRAAVSREINEETGVWIDPDCWHSVGVVEWGDRAELHLWSYVTHRFEQAQTMTEEEVSIVSIEHLGALDCCDHLALFIGMALSVEGLSILKFQS